MRVVTGLTALHTTKDKYNPFKYATVPHCYINRHQTISLHTVKPIITKYPLAMVPNLIQGVIKRFPD
jgi:hypothetical protein